MTQPHKPNLTYAFKNLVNLLEIKKIRIVYLQALVESNS